jgi:hypothetical protein
MNKIDYFIECINNNIPVSFLKYGDSEYICANKYNNNITVNMNCDNDLYTIKLSNAIKESFKFMVENASNLFISNWYNNKQIKNYWTSLTNKQINWADYNTFIFESHEIIDPSYNDIFIKKIDLYKTIKNCKQKKIMICNYLLIKNKILLNIDNVVIVPINNWFDNKFNDILKEIINLINTNEQYIIMTSCGMSAKVIIAELYKLFPNFIYFDIGSGLDYICTKINSRKNEYTYTDIYKKFLENNFIPQNWNDI